MLNNTFFFHKQHFYKLKYSVFTCIYGEATEARRTKAGDISAPSKACRTKKHCHKSVQDKTAQDKRAQVN